MRALVFVLLLFSLLLFSLFSSACFAQEKRNIATVSPICHSLTTALLKGTEVEVSYLPPKRLPLNRIPSWLNKNRSVVQAHFDAFVSLSSVRPSLNYFPSLRRTNIRVVNIDIAQAIFPGGERVVLVNKEDKFWLNSNNMLIMLGILKRDLSQLWPALQQTIDANYHAMSAHLRKTNLSVDAVLATQDISVVQLDNPSSAPFVASLAVDIMSENAAKDLGLKGIKLGSRYRKKQACSSSHQGCWLIDDFSKYRDISFQERIEENLQSLKTI